MSSVESDTLLTGVLMKKGSNYKTWKQRAFVFTKADKVLEYYVPGAPQNDANKKGMGRVLAVCDIDDRKGKRQHRIDIEIERDAAFPGGKWLPMAAPDAGEKQRWLDALRGAVPTRQESALDDDGNDPTGTAEPMDSEPRNFTDLTKEAQEAGVIVMAAADARPLVEVEGFDSKGVECMFLLLRHIQMDWHKDPIPHHLH